MIRNVTYSSDTHALGPNTEFRCIMTPRSRYQDRARGYADSGHQEEELEMGEPIPDEDEQPVAKKIPRAKPVQHREEDETSDNKETGYDNGRMVLSTAKYLKRNTDPEIARENRKTRNSERAQREGNGGPLAFEKNIINGGTVVGILAMGGAAVWFLAGLMIDIIFIYPPVLFIIGLCAFFKGMAKGK